MNQHSAVADVVGRGATALCSLFAFAATTVHAADRAEGLMYSEAASGLLSRSLFQSRDLGSHSLEIRDVLVGPGRRSAPLALTGGSILDVQAGSATLEIDGKSQAIKPGTVLSLKQGQSFAIDNRRQTRSLVARLIVVASPAR